MNASKTAALVLAAMAACVPLKASAFGSAPASGEPAPKAAPISPEMEKTKAAGAAVKEAAGGWIAKAKAKMAEAKAKREAAKAAQGAAAPAEGK